MALVPMIRVLDGGRGEGTRGSGGDGASGRIGGSDPVGPSRGSAGSDRDGAVAGLAFGTAYYLLLAHWLPATLHGLIPLGALIGAMGVAILVGIAGLQGVLLRRLLPSGRAPALLAVPAIWVTAEFLMARAGPIAFPWTPLGLSLAPVPALAASAEWGGVAVLTLWIGAVNGGIADLLKKRGRPRTALVTALAAALLLVPGAWGAWRVATLPEGEAGPMALTQLHIPRETLLDPRARDRAAATALTRIAAHGSTPLLLPESPFAATWEEGAGEWLRAFARARGAPVVAGARFLEEERERNGVILLDGEGRELLRHGKVRLVPAAEWPGTAAGPDRGVIPLDPRGGPTLGILICFETGFGSRARTLVRGGAELLANPTLDGWVRPVLGRASSGDGPPARVFSAAHAQHRAHLVLRAVETRRGAVRSSVSGELLVVDPSGRIRTVRAPGGEGVVEVRPVTTGIRTGFTRFGDMGGLAGLLLLAGLVISSGRMISGRTRG